MHFRDVGLLTPLSVEHHKHINSILSHHFIGGNDPAKDIWQRTLWLQGRVVVPEVKQ